MVYYMEIIFNNQAKYNYYLKHKFEAGLILRGWEVKSIRKNRVSLKESYIKILRKEVFVIGMNIVPDSSILGKNILYKSRNIKLLLKKNEIERLLMKLKKYLYFLIPTSLFFKGKLIKLSFSLGILKKKIDSKIKQNTYKKNIKNYIHFLY